MSNLDIIDMLVY